MDSVALSFEQLKCSAEKYDVTEWVLVRDALRLSEESLSYKPEMLPSQMLGRIRRVTKYRSLSSNPPAALPSGKRPLTILTSDS